MTQEYVTVQAPDERHPRKQPKPASTPTRRRRLIAVALAVSALVWAGLGIASMWPNPVPEPHNFSVPMERTPDAARTTALVYQEWLNRGALVECLHERGLEYERSLESQHERTEAAAQYLEVEPATAHPEAPVPLLRQPALYSARGGVETAAQSEPCVMPTTRVDTSDADAVSAAVDQARTDDDFLAALAEQVWAQQNPAEVTHQVSLLRDDGQTSGSGIEDDSAWSGQLAVVTQAIQDGTVWVPFTTSHTEEYGQSVGLVASGGAVAVRVSAGDVLLDAQTHMTHTDVIRCGPITMSTGVLTPWGNERDLGDVMHGMATACNALIGAGYAQGQTLAEVYWD